MKANGSFLWNRIVSLATVVAIVLAGAPGAAFAQAKGTSPQKVAAVAAPAPEATSAKKAPSQGGGQQEGIKVHGHWTIEVRNPDGTLARRHEFENALSGGDVVLSLLLNRWTPGRWELSLANLGGQGSPCQGGTGGRFPNWCRIIESTASNPNGGNAESTDLQVSLSGNNSVRLAGTITALSNGVIDRVSTSFGLCPPPTPLATCNVAGDGRLFSDAQPNPVPVVAGQIIQVTVFLFFS